MMIWVEGIIGAGKTTFCRVVTGGKYLGQVEADSLEEAMDIVDSGKGPAQDVSFCCQCAKECENAEVTDLTVVESNER